ncbi:MAG: alpha amylase C-terminal domain-containing protein [Rikenellaceae bacterium]|nr:alpha amylase C-terminal domain-containing protein [Rikenellaceae bacterium]
MDRKRLAIVERDEWLRPVEGELEWRHALYEARLRAIESAAGSIVDYANGHRYFGFQRDEQARGWWFREWLPGARAVFLFGDFNDWDRRRTPLGRGEGGVWSVFLSDEGAGRGLVKGSRLKMLVAGDNGEHERIPAYIRRVEQDEQTKDFAGVFWTDGPFDWGGDTFDVTQNRDLLIYECHIGMAQEKEGVGSCAEFTERVLPRIRELGYTAVQLMAVAEHPYYGSFGYHVSNFFAPSSRFGTPDDYRTLVRTAHEMGLAVIMDVVHSHYVKNFNEGLNELDGTDRHYSRPGPEGDHPHWDSKLFDYGKGEVTHFLLSNLKYWMEEFHFDGFRFDGVTSMIYHHHGYTEFDSRDKFFDGSVNRDALTYLALANRLVHAMRPTALTIAEDVSGMPGMCAPIDDGGVGFDYRLGMAVPDYWIRLLKEVRDEQWNLREMWHMMTDRLPGVKTIAYAESHDQALVGDKTLAFRLMDKEMYVDMERARPNPIIDRGMALHKMIRLMTVAAAGQAYLNFMGNEFGHPEWIDFPREGNGWSYAHARRQWPLASDPFLRYSFLNDFDRAMIGMVRRYGVLRNDYPWQLLMDEASHTMAFSRGGLVFVFNWHPTVSIPDYVIPVGEPGAYRIALDTDACIFGGQQRNDPKLEHLSYTDGERHFIKIYNVCRTAVVFRKEG